MKPTLTTITPYWGRPEMLRRWVRAMQGATNSGTEHILFCVGEPVPDSVARIPWLRCYRYEEKPGRSIGHFHNLGAELANTEWIMKLDVDTMPNVRYFQELLPLLACASEKQWFNGGMLYVGPTASQQYLSEKALPLMSAAYNAAQTQAVGNYLSPQATNWICRRKTYLGLGGCDEAFEGYGWEDYQQIYMLEAHEQGRCPLPGPLSLDTVTRRCRDEIARPKAAQLFSKSPWLCLLHHWHPVAGANGYRSHIHANRAVLLRWITRYRSLHPGGFYD